MGHAAMSLELRTFTTSNINGTTQLYYGLHYTTSLLEVCIYLFAQHLHISGVLKSPLVTLY